MDAINDGRWSVDFSLALFNRSGKYFIGKAIVEQNADLIAQVRYWRLPYKAVPQGLAARLIGKLEAWEHRSRAALDRPPPPAAPGRRRCLHLDPLTVLHCRLGPQDMVLCHDLGPLTHPELFARRVGEHYDLAYRAIRDRQPELVFVSHASEAAFRERYGAPRRAHVIYPPIRADSVDTASEPCAAVRPPFLLTVGSIGWRKNQAAAIRAFASSGLAGRGFSYAICGAREPGYEEAAALAARTPGVVLLPYVTDATLRWLYAEAAAFVLPSRLEGFGMPVAEAMRHGLIPVISSGSVLEEVTGPGAIGVDPTSDTAIAAGMSAVAALSPAERDTRQALLREQVHRFSEEAFRRQWREALAATSSA
jgi:glycosyltransferase involved in cell wall biosynthesis